MIGSERLIQRLKDPIPRYMHNPKEKNEVYLRFSVDPAGTSHISPGCFAFQADVCWHYFRSGALVLAKMCCSLVSHSSPEQGFLLKALSWVEGHRRWGQFYACKQGSPLVHLLPSYRCIREQEPTMTAKSKC